MIKEHALITLSEGKGECICNPEILIGSTFGLWDSEYRVAPKGTLMDLNAAWELFFDKRTFMNDLRFNTTEHYLTEIIDDVIYYNGDVTYTLLTKDGEKTNASFTIRGNKPIATSIEWKNRSLIIYQDNVRAERAEDLSSGYNIHYVTDSNGNHVMDKETGKPFIYDYVAIPLFDVFDLDEMHKLFSWFADSLHTVRLRLNLDNPNNTTEGHLGDFAITKESEVFIAKEPVSENSGNILISLLSLINLLYTTLGITPVYLTDNTIVDDEGSSIHLRVTGFSGINSSITSLLEELSLKIGAINNLSTLSKTDIVSSINEIVLTITNNLSSSTLSLLSLSLTLQQTINTLLNHLNNSNNPHNVQATQLSVTVNDPNDSNNTTLELEYNVNYNVSTALLKLFLRLNIAEDLQTLLSAILATAGELQLLDLLDSILGNDTPTIVGTLLGLYNSRTPITDTEIDNIVNTYFLP